jgi:hypothetical protein
LSPWTNDVKDGALLSDIIKKELDIVLMQETGVNWSVIPRKHQWMERSKQYFEPNTSKVSFGFNRHDKTKSLKQWGGTGIFTRGKLIHFSMGTGTDKKVLEDGHGHATEDAKASY